MLKAGMKVWVLLFLLFTFSGQVYAEKKAYGWEHKEYRENCERLFSLEKNGELQTLDRMLLTGCKKEEKRYGKLLYRKKVREQILAQKLKREALNKKKAEEKQRESAKKQKEKKEKEKEVLAQKEQEKQNDEKLTQKSGDDEKHLRAIKKRKSETIKAKEKELAKPRNEKTSEKKSEKKIENTEEAKKHVFYDYFLASFMVGIKGEVGINLEFTLTDYFNLGASALSMNTNEHKYEEYIKLGYGSYRKNAQIGVKLSYVHYSYDDQSFLADEDIKDSSLGYMLYAGTHLNYLHVGATLGFIGKAFDSRFYFGFVF